MCTLIFIYNMLQDFPIVALHNRYARIGSSEEPPTLSKNRVVAYHPVDSFSKGTWIGFNDAGLFIAATDQHTNSFKRAYRSRGLLLLDILTNFKQASPAKAFLETELKRNYRRGNFILADSNNAYHILKDKWIETTSLKEGSYVVTNITLKEWVDVKNISKDLLKFVEKRRARALNLISKMGFDGINETIKDLKCIASDHGEERGRGSICYHNGTGWYMSSSTIIAVANKISDSKIFYCKGNPCESEFIDYSYLLRCKIFSSSQIPRMQIGGVEVLRRSSKLLGKRIALCLTGSVATIESPKLARWLRRHGAYVRCYMTKMSIEYGVSPKVMEWATGNPVVLELTGATEHLEDYDLVVVYPATLNTLCKIANGIADNPVTTLCASTRPTKLLVAPAMNLRLYDNPVFRRTLNSLAKLGVTIVQPRISEGAAKVASIEKTVDYILRCLSTSVLKGRGILILTGSTRYDLDPVRYISNKASGRIGYWLAKEAFQRGANVKVVYGPRTVSFPEYIPVDEVYTVEEMLDATLKSLETGNYEIAIFSAAILDFKPSEYIAEKVKSGSKWTVELSPTPKIIDEVSKLFPQVRIIGFKLEFNVPKEKLINEAKEEMSKFGATIVVANDLAEIREDRHKAYLLSRSGEIKEFDGNKSELAKEILDLLEVNLLSVQL